MSTSEPLSCLHEGQRARVLSILESGAMRRRLQDIGLIEGTTVELSLIHILCKKWGSLYHCDRGSLVLLTDAQHSHHKILTQTE